MLYIVLTLVLAALGLVVSALVTANSLWAWISIALSGVAGVLLVVDWWRRRSAGSAGGDVASASEKRPPGSEADASDASGKAATVTDADGADRDDDADHETTLLPVSGRLVGADGEPIEEQADEADALVVANLDAEVLVVDEHPRYHLAECGWLADTDTIPLPVKEARELGFTPCALCGPDATLAADHRTSRATRK